MKRYFVKKHIFIYSLLFCLIVSHLNFPSFADKKADVDSQINSLPTSDWPDAPQISSEAAILVELNTGVILYAKNATKLMYPASTTKLMTALLTLENCDLDDIHTFTASEVNTIPSGSSHIGMRPNESLTVRDCLYGLLLPSANEVANGLAIQVGGDMDSFVELMNQRAQELGCVNTHFVNPNGLHNENHYTCAYDLFLILQACVNIPSFVEISSSPTYYRYADELLDKDIPMANTHSMIRINTEYYYEKAICGKTGWTDEAGRCLTTYASDGSIDLICVTMNAEAPQQFIDTKTLLEYGFQNFSVVNAATHDTIYSGSSSADSLLNIPFPTIQLLQMSANSHVLLPSTREFSNLDTQLTTSSDGVYTLNYSLNGYPLGTASLFAPQAVVKNPLKIEKEETLIISSKDTQEMLSIVLSAVLPPFLLILIALLSFVLYIHHKTRRRYGRLRRH
ncbi:MAG: D-alanyl-D-alanine carboxypeptidase family protein [Lachnospiraceae bacterium]